MSILSGQPPTRLARNQTLRPAPGGLLVDPLKIDSARISGTGEAVDDAAPMNES